MIHTFPWRRAAIATTLLASLAGCMQTSSPAQAPGQPTAAPAQPAAAPVAPAANQVPLVATEEAKLGTAPNGMGLPAGTKAPDAELRDVTGATVKLAELYARGPVFLVFYRGGWCPFCNAQLHALTEARAEFAKRGVTLAAISVDVPGESAKTQAKTGAPFPMLSDPKLVAHGAFQIVHQTSEQERQKLAGYGVDLGAFSGESHGNFATPAIFYVDRGGVIRFAHVDEDYKTRPSPTQLLAIADRLATAR